MASTDMTRLAGFQRHFEDMRAHIHCKICLKPFYEPFTLSCGHTYCYSCLSSWCTGTHNRGKAKTCPDCRAVVMTQPSPNFILRDLVQMFLTHTELLPEDETIEEHREAKEAEIRLVTADRAGPGLFKGLFAKNRYLTHGFARAAPIVDAADGVERCPSCTWELEDGICGHCGWSLFLDDDDSYDSEEDERDISPLEEFRPVVNPVTGRPYSPATALWRQHGHVSGDDEEPYASPQGYSVQDDDSEDDSENEDDDDDMSGFITNDEDLPDEVDDDDESVHTIHGYNADSPARQYSTDGGYTHDDNSVAQQTSPPRTFYGIDLSGDSNDGEDSQDDETTVTRSTQPSSEASDSADEASEQQTNYDTDSSSIREVSPPVIHQISITNRAKRRRIIVDDEDDEDENEADSDDTAIRPPQQHRNQRQRRTNGFTFHGMPHHARFSLSSDEDPPRRFGGQPNGGFNQGQATEANAVPLGRRGRPATARVF